MSRTPVCPVCGSTAVTPDATNGGAGRNICHCGHRAPVRDFYQARRPQEIGRGLRSGRQSPHIIDDMTWMERPAPGRVNYVTEPVAAVLMPNGELNDMRHNREPAPIRQYKDD